MLDLPTLLAITLPCGQAAGEWFAMRRTESIRRERHPEWTFYAVNIPYWLMITLGITEHVRRSTSPSTTDLLLGTVLACSGIALRIACHFQLAGGFSPYVELGKSHRLVTNGLYRYVRHPMYVGSLMLFAGLPLILASPISWLMAALAGIAFVFRIGKEERLLSKHLPGYQDYMARTWRLLPYVW